MPTKRSRSMTATDPIDNRPTHRNDDGGLPAHLGGAPAVVMAASIRDRWARGR